jgi:DNA-binding NarL/FixJ family response regulator
LRLANPAAYAAFGGCAAAAASRFFGRDDEQGADKAPEKLARIVVVEDDFLVASEMENALRQAGFYVAGVASSAEKALQLAAAHRPALVVMDVHLIGKRDGVDAALELFGRYGIRCIFATAHHDPDTRARAYPAPPLAWLSKPYAMRSLVDVVRQALVEVRRDKQ